MDKKGLVFNIQRFCLDDGTGIRTCVFLKGCPLACAWCHNIESQSFRKEIGYSASRCIGCGNCIAVCDEGCHYFDEAGKHVFLREKCIQCGKCADVCDSQAIQTVGEWKSCADIMDVVMRDFPFYGDLGGVTVTGGEPMAQFEFTYELAKEAKKAHISFMLETSGYGKTEDFIKIATLCDGFLFDCKAADADHHFLTGVSDELILRNLRVLSDLGANIVLRCPVVKGGNLNDAFLHKIADLANEIKGIQKVELMPYHKTGLSKSKWLGIKKQEEYSIFTDEEIENIREQLRSLCRVKVS